MQLDVEIVGTQPSERLRVMWTLWETSSTHWLNSSGFMALMMASMLLTRDDEVKAGVAVGKLRPCDLTVAWCRTRHLQAPLRPLRQCVQRQGCLAGYSIITAAAAHTSQDMAAGRGQQHHSQH